MQKAELGTSSNGAFGKYATLDEAQQGLLRFDMLLMTSSKVLLPTG